MCVIDVDKFSASEPRSESKFFFKTVTPPERNIKVKVMNLTFLTLDFGPGSRMPQLVTVELLT